MSRRRIVGLVVLAAVAGVGFLVIRQRSTASASASAELQTEQVMRGTLEVAVNAAGSLAAPQSASLLWRTTGIVRSVRVEVGDTVRAGDVMIELDPASLDPTIIEASSELAAAQRDLDDLLHSNLARAEAQQAVADAREALRVAQYNHDVRQEGHRATAETIEVARARLLLAKAELAEELNEYEDASHGGDDNLVSALALEQLTSARSGYNSALATYNWFTGHPTEIEQAILEAEVAIAQAKLEDAERAYERLKNGPDPLGKSAAEARVAAAQAAAEKARIAAPFDGTVVAVSARIGDVVDNGNEAVVLANLQSLEVEVDVSEIDINQIAIGQEAQLTLDAVPGQTFRGVVSAVTGSGQVEQGVVTFPVTVEITDPNPLLKPGMTAAVSIVTEKVAAALLVPNRAIRVSGGQRTVVVLFEGQQIEVPVTLGLSNESFSEVLDGTLQEGDAVVLNATTTAQTGFQMGPGGGGAVHIP